MARELDLGAYRLLVRFTLILSITLVVFGIYQLLQLRFWLGVVALVAGVLALLPSQWFAIRPDPGAQFLLVLLSRPDCLLCEEARATLRTLTEGTPFTVQVVDIQEHRHLRRRFKNWVPVVLWQGEELARVKVDADTMRAQLERIKARTSAPLSAPV